MRISLFDQEPGARKKPGKIHQFEGLEDGVAFELYWAEFNHDDIVRRTSGTAIGKSNTK